MYVQNKQPVKHVFPKGKAVSNFEKLNCGLGYNSNNLIYTINFISTITGTV
jgi:hypothetical protein